MAEKDTIWMKGEAHTEITGEAKAAANISLEGHAHEEITGSATPSFLYKLITEFPKEKEYLQYPGDFKKIPDEMRKLFDGIDIEDISLIRRASHGMWPNFVVTKVEEVSSTHIPPQGDKPGEQNQTVNVYVTDKPTAEECMKAWGSRLDFEREWGVIPNETMYALIKSNIFTVTNEGREIRPALYASSKDIAKYLQPIRDELTKAAAADEPTERELSFLLINETVRKFNPYIHTLKKEPEFIDRPIEDLANVTLDYFKEKTNSQNTLIHEGRKLDILNWEVLRDNFRFFYPCTKNDLQDFIKYARERLAAVPIPGKRTVIPDRVFFETDKGAAKVFDGSLYKLDPDQQAEIRLEKYNAKKPIRRFIRIDREQIPPEIFKRKLSDFDFLIHDAVNSIYQAGNEFMTISTIANVINGNPGNNYNPSPKTRREIEDSIKALIYTPIIMDFSQEAEAYKAFNYQDGKAYQYLGNVIHGEIVTEKVNGQLTEGVLHVLKEPILFTLARKKEQIATIPIKVLNSPVHMTKGAFELRDYLMRRIDKMKPTGDKKEPKDLKQRTIVLSSMYAAIGAENKRSDEKKRIFEKAIEFLDDWKNKDYILDYAVDNERIYIAISQPQRKEIEKIQNQSFFKMIDKREKNKKV